MSLPDTDMDLLKELGNDLDNEEETSDNVTESLASITNKSFLQKFTESKFNNGSTSMSSREIMTTFRYLWSTQKFGRGCCRCWQISRCLWSSRPLPWQSLCLQTAHRCCYMHSVLRVERCRQISRRLSTKMVMPWQH